MGCSIVMDDFGVGHSNMSYLWKFPFDKLKIDRSFIAAPAEASTTIVPILQTIVNLGRALNMRITAEGIETEEQAKLFVALDCDFMQGYLFGRPMLETEIAGVIHQDFIARSSMTDRATAIERRKGRCFLSESRWPVLSEDPKSSASS
jgi:EAL domain-containing protein (putative c-di-GMP-specific phosphodiesterase class I)